MSILGIGVDVVALDRIETLCMRRPEQFAERIFTEKERALFSPKPVVARIAARFAVKEAVSKALGTGIGTIAWQDIETVNAASGQPEVHLYGQAASLAAEKGVKKVHCSISHEKTVAVAMIILEG
ncbi:MAG: holo-ACP synthase [Peptococcaceae bacterium]|nr:holo-ACP synthase [Peptococcaceae bacterium]